MKWIVLLLALGAVFFSTAASARPYHLTPVSWIVATRDNLNVDDRYVTIVGHVTRRISDEEYWFTDGTGQVRLDSENFDLPIGRRIVIGGRIDQAYLGFGHIEVDVRKWHYAPLRPGALKTAVVAPRPTPVKARTSASSSTITTPADAAPSPQTVRSTTSTSASALTNASPGQTNASSLAPPPESH